MISMGTFSAYAWAIPGKGVLDSRPRLRCKHAVLSAATDTRIAIGNADADTLLTTQDGADVEGGAGLDQRIARIAAEKLGTLARRISAMTAAPFMGVSFKVDAGILGIHPVINEEGKRIGGED